MRVLGPPEIRAVWLDDLGYWAALEGCHRLRACEHLDLEPVVRAVRYQLGMKWADVGMAHDYIAGAITLDQVVDNARAGKEYIIGLGEDRLPRRHEVRRPKPGEIMKYRVKNPINFDFDGVVVGGQVGTIIETERDLVDYVTQGFLEVVEEKKPAPKKTTKERLLAPKRKSKAVD